MLAVGAVGLFGHFFSLVYHFSLLSPSLCRVVGWCDGAG